jgi:carbamate kinase
MRVVVALGGNAILKRGEAMTARNQWTSVRRAAKAIAQVIEAGHDVVVTHGNGPQIGLMALQDMAHDVALASPIDVLGAETAGMIGYMIARELGNALPVQKEIAVLLTQIEVDPTDLAFQQPTKPIGPVYNDREAADLTTKHGWVMVQDGSHFRRAVASPRPKRILEIETIRLLINQNVTVICAGGGGIPVIPQSDGGYIGVEAVIDKDHASGLLAREIKAEALLLLTDVDGVYLAWGTPQQRRLSNATPNELNAHRFAAGSMGPKIAAAVDFATFGGTTGIGRLEDALDILEQRAGTVVKL